ncbi:hypothetical protein ABZ070_18835 [Streptomyces sp. NPDC006283]|uniref:hypothetical protein n=1 Tax=Streptomyces sp. NPDC006283 TaxID=3156741 RepID=UPI0033B4D763
MASPAPVADAVRQIRLIWVVSQEEDLDPDLLIDTVLEQVRATGQRTDLVALLLPQTGTRNGCSPVVRRWRACAGRRAVGADGRRGHPARW